MILPVAILVIVITQRLGEVALARRRRDLVEIRTCAADEGLHLSGAFDDREAGDRGAPPSRWMGRPMS